VADGKRGGWEKLVPGFAPTMFLGVRALVVVVVVVVVVVAAAAAGVGLSSPHVVWCVQVLGGTGITAYFGLLRVGLPKAGETVLVSGAAGGTLCRASVVSVVSVVRVV